ncbi:hypothetical protein [Lactobacillus delbrueckii]|nr:hypothetical protein [Lactobacillus delbrueckii]
MNSKHMVLKIKQKSILMFTFLATLFFNTLGWSKIVEETTVSKVSVYIFVLLPMVIGIVLLAIQMVRGTLRLFYFKELLVGIALFALFIGVSLIKSYQTGKFAVGTFGEAARIVAPFIYTFIVVNILSLEDIDKLMILTLYVAWVAYLINQFIITGASQRALSISFIDSSSPFENSEVAAIAFAVACYFIYFLKRHPIYCFWSILLSIACFKRVLMLFTIVLFLYSVKLNKTKRLNRLVKWPLLLVTSAIFLAVTVFYLYIMEPQNLAWTWEKLHFDVDSFSMYRSYRVQYLLQHNYVSYGLSSSTSFLNTNPGSWYTNHTLELDLIKILIELGKIPLIIFVLAYYSLAYESMYAYLVTTAFLVNLLMASGLNEYYAWFVMLVTFALIRHNNVIDENYGEDK